MICFWRPTLLVIVCFATAVVVCMGLTGQPDENTIIAQSIGLDLEKLAVPTARLFPEDVVRAQLVGLQDHEDPLGGALQCYCFAAPNNKRVTGPFERFQDMVRRAPFDVLGTADQFLIGRPIQADGQARVLVSLVAQGRLRLFVFVLRRQETDPHRNCWMTEAVFPLPAPEMGLEGGPVEPPEPDPEANLAARFPARQPLQGTKTGPSTTKTG